MRQLIFLALFILTWQSFEARFVPVPSYFSTLSNAPSDRCQLVESNHTERFDDEKKALARKTALEKDKENINVKIYEAKPYKETK